MNKLKLSAAQTYKGKKLLTIGIYSRNREEWVITDIACWLMSITSVPLYDTLGEESICWTFEQTQLSTIFLSPEGIIKLLNIAKKGRIPTLKKLVVFGEPSEEDKTMADEIGIEIMTFNELINEGKREIDMKFNPCGPDDILTICYTSGTTDKAKGTVITHRNFRSDAASALYSNIFVGYQVGFEFISYLPLAHVFERVIVYIGILGGFRFAFYHGVVAELANDISTSKPDVIAGVPRVFGRFYDGVMKAINSSGGFKSKLVKSVIDKKIKTYRANGCVTHLLYDSLVLSKIRNSFGGQIKALVSSAAPLDVEIMDTLRVLFSCIFLQACGQTECSGAIAISYYNDIYPGSSGPPMMCSLAKVIDVPEMNYLSTDITNGVNTPRGELCLKGDHLTKEYFKDPEKSAQLYDKEGWMHTGDIALITPQGGIKIIDRKKNIFKLQHGEYVAPEKIENILSTSPWILQLFLYGDSYQSYLIGILIPQQNEVMKWGKEHNVSGTFEELCKNEDLNLTILKDLATLGREKKVNYF